MYSSTHRGIRITVLSEHVEGDSEIRDRRFMFRYLIRIENLAEDQVELIERYCLVTSGGVRIAEIVGPVVEGEKLSIAAGETVELTSETTLRDPFGTLEGNYFFRSDKGEYFSADIPKFDFCYPVIIH
jgi:uncharacterized protein affecting Mg2+/Co2+ transport